MEQYNFVWSILYRDIKIKIIDWFISKIVITHMKNMKILRRAIKLIFLFTPLVIFAVIYFLPDSWKSLYPQDTLSIIFIQIENLYSSNPFALITIFGTAFGLITYYYGTLINSENKYSKVSESI